VQSIGRWKVVEWQRPVYLRGATSRFVTVAPGDFILADEDGALVITKDIVGEVLRLAEGLTEMEVKIRAALRGGMSLQQALDQFGHV
jgi:regulator of RNase E activity RraA